MQAHLLALHQSVTCIGMLRQLLSMGEAVSMLPALAYNPWQALQGANVSCDCHIHFLHRQNAWPEQEADI